MNNTLFTSTVRSTLISVFSAAVLGLLLLFPATAVASGAEDPDSLTAPLSLASLGLSALFCGILSSRLSDGEIPTALAGVISGAVFGLLLFVVSFVPASSGSDFIAGRRLLFTALVIVLSLLGSVIGRKRGKKRSSYVKHIRKKRR